MELTKLIAKRTFYFAIFVGIVIMLAKLCTIHSKDVNPEDYINGLPPIFGLLNTEYFQSFVFCATIGIYLIIAAILWHYHEVPLHKAQRTNSAFINVVFGLALCGLIFDKLYFVAAIVLAFMPWKVIGAYLTQIMSTAYHTRPEDIDTSLIQAHEINDHADHKEK